LLACNGGLYGYFCKGILQPTLPKNQLQTRRLRRLTGHGAVVTGEVNLNFTQSCQRNQPQSNERHDALSFQTIKSQSGTLLRPAFAV